VSDSDDRPGVIIAKTANSTIRMQEAGALITNRGATATTAHQLGKAAYWKGKKLRFLRVAAYAMRLTPATGEQILIPAGTLTTASKYRELGTDGAMQVIESDGTNWVVTYERGTINEEA
jgi:hypothetical protein